MPDRTFPDKDAPKAGTARDCKCGHSAKMHEWTSIGNAGLVRMDRCGYMHAQPRRYDEAEVRWEPCRCIGYQPAVGKCGHIGPLTTMGCIKDEGHSGPHRVNLRW